MNNKNKLFRFCGIAFCFAVAMLIAFMYSPVEVKAAAPEEILYMSFDKTMKDEVSEKKMSKYGNIKYVKGKFGKAAYFDGDRDYVELKKQYDLSEMSFSLNFWVKAESEDKSDAAIFSKYETNLYGPYDFYLTYNKPAIWISDGRGGYEVYISDTVLSSDKWYMITVVYSAKKSKLTLYINGKVDNSWKIIPITTNKDTVMIGTQALDVGRKADYRGAIDELRLYKGVLSKKMVKKLYKNNSLE